MEPISIVIAAASDSKLDDVNAIQGILERALLEYDASRRNRSLQYQWLELQTAQQLIDHLQLILDAGHDNSQNCQKYLGLLRHLSKRFQTLPSSLIVDDVKREGQNYVAGGGFADIWRGSMNERPVCLKVLRLAIEQDEKTRAEIRKQFCHEALVWRQLKHPNILPLLGVNTDLFSPSFCLISPWMENRDIITYLRRNPQHSLPSVLSEVAAGLRYLHSRDPPVVHGDIRGGNILVTDDLRCCLADFGLTLVTTTSQVWSFTTSSSSSKGSMRWLAPEYNFGLTEQAPGNHHTPRDVYAFGCTIIEILTQKVPFHDLKTDALVMLKLMTGGRPLRPQGVWCPDVVWDLTSRCWAEDAQDRPSGNEIYETLQEILEFESAVEPSGSSVNSTMVAEISGELPPAVEDISRLTGQSRLRDLKRKRDGDLTVSRHQKRHEQSPQGNESSLQTRSMSSMGTSLVYSQSGETGPDQLQAGAGSGPSGSVGQQHPFSPLSQQRMTSTVMAPGRTRTLASTPASASSKTEPVSTASRVTSARQPIYNDSSRYGQYGGFHVDDAPMWGAAIGFGRGEWSRFLDGFRRPSGSASASSASSRVSER